MSHDTSTRAPHSKFTPPKPKEPSREPRGDVVDAQVESDDTAHACEAPGPIADQKPGEAYLAAAAAGREPPAISSLTAEAGSAPPVMRIYTDGSCIGNPGPGGWAYVTSVGDEIHSGFGHCCARTTNIEMELIAVVQALRTLERVDLPVTVYIDLEYISNCINEWLPKWEKNGWRTNKGKPVAHRRILEDLKALRDARGPGAEITFAWIKGHAGHPGNEEADRLAQAAAATASRSPLTCRTRYDAEAGLMISDWGSAS